MKHNFRIIPWWADSAIVFLNNIFKWYPNLLRRQCSVLETGGGNSSLYLLNKRCRVTTIEGDQRYINYMANVATNAGFKVNVCDKFNVNKDYDLNIIQVDKYERKKFDDGHWYSSLKIDNVKLEFDILINDGIDRLFFLKKFIKSYNSILILDNVECAANWGKLTKLSADTNRSSEYRKFLRNTSWNKISFEQAEGRNGRTVADFIGVESDHRKITTVAWYKNHLFNKMMITDKGFPIVNDEAIDDYDLKALKEKFPYDKEKKQWVKKEKYPKILNKDLKRNYD